nr:MAG TPA: hypothetical protein [Crassvirales sp.]
MIAQYIFLFIITNIIVLIVFAICIISVYKNIDNVLIKTNRRIDDLLVCLNVVQENNKYNNEMFDKLNHIEDGVYHNIKVSNNIEGMTKDIDIYTTEIHKSFQAINSSNKVKSNNTTNKKNKSNRKLKTAKSNKASDSTVSVNKKK